MKIYFAILFLLFWIGFDLKLLDLLVNKQFDLHNNFWFFNSNFLFRLCIFFGCFFAAIFESRF